MEWKEYKTASDCQGIAENINIIVYDYAVQRKGDNLHNEYMKAKFNNDSGKVDKMEV